MMFSVLAGCGNDADTTPTKDAAGNETTPTQGGIIGALEDLLTQTYEFDCGASVTAPIGMNPLDAPGYTAALSGLNVAFVLLEEPPLSVNMPPWAIRLVLDTPALERTVKELDLTLGSDLEELPQL
jgi:hypothetical protein